MSTFSYFAYGSNMLEQRMMARLDIYQRGAFNMVRATLSGHMICYHKRSKDGSGKLTVVETGNVADVVYGVVYCIQKLAKVRLDRQEGLRRGYDERTITVKTESGELREVVLYYAVPEAIDPSLKPYSWYRDLVVAGARQLELPDEYVQMLDVAAWQDPDEGREHKHRVLLAAV